MATLTPLIKKFNGLLLEKAPLKRGLLSFFNSRPENITDATTITYNKQGFKKLVARAKNRTADPTKNDFSAFRSVPVVPPKYDEEVDLTLADYDRAQANETEYDASLRITKMMGYVATQINSLYEKIVRAMHLQAKEIFKNGKILFKTNNLADNVPDLDYEAPATNFHTLTNTGDELFFNNASSDIRGILENHCKLISTNSNGIHKVDRIIFGQLAYSAAINNSKFVELYNKINFSIGEIAPKEADIDGFSAFGTIVLNGKLVYLYTLDESALSPADNTTMFDFVDEKDVIFIASSGSYEIYHAGIDVIKQNNELANISIPSMTTFINPTGAITAIGDRIATSMYVSTNVVKDVVWLEVKTFPLLVPETADSFGRLTVLA